MMKLSPRLRLAVTLQAAKTVLAQPVFATLSLMSSLAMLGIMVWSTNYQLVWFIATQSTLRLTDKIGFVMDGYRNLFSGFSAVTSLGMILFSLLFGLNLSCLLFILSKRQKVRVPIKSNGGALTMAIVSGGCIACGTSFITPLVATFGSAATPLVEQLSFIAVWLGAALLVVSIMQVSTVIIALAPKTKIST
jgi:hypothetical protein